MIDARDLAARRRELHGRARDPRNDRDDIGADGEKWFGGEFGLPVDTAARPFGDDGVDFVVAFGHELRTIDVKTFQKPNNLLVPVAQIERAVTDWYVLCRWDAGKVEPVGWEMAEIMQLMPTGYFGHAILNRFRAADLLRPFDQLRDMMRRRTR